LSGEDPRVLIAIGDNCLDLFVERDVVTAGGNALNVAAQWRLAGHAARYFGAVGDDAEGGLMLAAIAAAGLDPADVEILRGETAVTRLVGEGGERRFLEERLGVGAHYLPSFERLAAAAGAGWVHLGTNTKPELVQRLRAAGVRFSVDLSTREPAFALEGVALAVASAETAAAQPKLEALRQAGAQAALVTCGAHGAWFDDGVQVWRVAAEPVEVMDTCGAGDSFIAAFTAAWGVEGRAAQVSLRQAARAAAATGRHVGGFPQRVTAPPAKG
jgi:fructoselysine 6-kinase